MIASRNEGSLNALSGVLFVALSVTGAVLAGLLAPVPYPYPGAPPAEIVRYFAEGRAAVLAAGLLQALAAVSLLAFSQKTRLSHEASSQKKRLARTSSSTEMPCQGRSETVRE